MKLKTNIFLWVFLATAVPICIITLYATKHSERLYQKDVDREIAGSLNNIASEIRRRLLLDRDLLRGLSKAHPVQAFLPTLRQISQGEVHAEHADRFNRMKHFLEDIQEVVSQTSQFRVLDVHGNNLATTQHDQNLDIFEPDARETTAAETPYKEGEFYHLVEGLVAGEIRYILNPAADVDPLTLEPVPLYDMILALGGEEKPFGYISAKVRFGPIDRLLHVSPRLHNGRLFIAEIDPENEERDGLILYDDREKIALGTERLQAERFQLQQPDTYELVQRELFGFVDSADGSVRTYYSEFLPYPDRLLIWVLGIQIDLDQLGAPFSRVRAAILGVGLLALISSLALTRIGARRIALPITHLAAKLADFAQGEHQQRIKIRGTDEIRQAGHAFNNMAVSFQQTEQERDQARDTMLQKAKLASIGQLAAGIGHEINNPLHNIITLTKLMEQHYPRVHDGLRKDITSVHKEARRASRIVQALLNFARETPLETTCFEVGPWLQETLSLIEQKAKEQRVFIKREIQGDYLLQGDRNLLQQTLINLLLNALQASAPGGEILVITKMRDKFLVIEVHDEGTGIASDVQDRIFDPFFSTKTAKGGSGLGLSISLGIIEQHGGELSLHNRPQGGVKAEIVLPHARVSEGRVSNALESSG